ncbi:MAG TPA: hypothetical protein PKA63_07500 [Oligoflexia bacterium]|nr:hypothetical protein [Oligoflexia bacterium]HMP48494.1 hypothetical protein [Oligoflexia bacterium]
MNNFCNIKGISYSELIEYANEVANGKHQGLIPIDRHRARQLVKNPLAANTDYALVIAFDSKNKCVGYMGLIPGVININGSNRKIAWTSTGKISKNRNASYLGMEFAKSYYDTIISTGNNEISKRFYRRHNFNEVKINLSRNFHAFLIDPFLLSIKIITLIRLKLSKHKSEKSSSLTQKILLTISAKYRNILAGLIKLPSSEVIINQSSTLSREISTYLTLKRKYSFSHSNHSLEWIVNNPWFLSLPIREIYNKSEITNENDTLSINDIEKKYAFNSLSKKIKYKVISLKDKNGEILAGLVCSFSEDNEKIILKILDYNASSIKAKKYLGYIIIRNFLQSNASIFTFPKDFINDLGFLSFVLKLSIANYNDYFFWSNDETFLDNIQNLSFSMLDGDSPHW